MAVRPVLSIALAAVAGMLAGCSALPADSAATHRPGPYDAYCASNHDPRLLNAPCRKPFGYGSNHCGLQGVACTLSNEACALVHVMGSSHWKGDYPHGACGPWVGEWHGCCGDGGIADPCGDAECLVVVPEAPSE
jgi:hypothetical protein